MKNEIINSAWKEQIEKANENDWYVLPIIAIASLIILGVMAGVENMFNVFAEFIGGVVK